jgi:hypothetical protein
LSVDEVNVVEIFFFDEQGIVYHFIISLVSGSLLYASFHVACWGNLSMVAPDKNAQAVATAAASLDHSTNSD